MRVVGELAAEVVGRLAAAERFDTLEALLAWCSDLVEIVVQDEFTHDVVMRAGGAYLVFDTT